MIYYSELLEGLNNKLLNQLKTKLMTYMNQQIDKKSVLEYVICRWKENLENSKHCKTLQGDELKLANLVLEYINGRTKLGFLNINKVENELKTLLKI
jgi:hypothetical protein